MKQKTAKLITLITVMLSTTGCQLLIDNRNRESGAVVVVPSEEWEAMRQLSLTETKEPVSTEMSSTQASKTPAMEATVKIEPFPGSESIAFTSYTGASLGGCTTHGIIEVQHRGGIDEAITLLKNEAFRLSSNLLIPTKISNEQTEVSNVITFEARMLTCPLKLARGN